MTPKEKAEDLIKKFSPFVDYVRDGWCDEKLQREEAKECALVCVDEIIRITDPMLNFIDAKNNYWHDVRAELQSL